MNPYKLWFPRVSDPKAQDTTGKLKWRRSAGGYRLAPGYVLSRFEAMELLLYQQKEQALVLPRRGVECPHPVSYKGLYGDQIITVRNLIPLRFRDYLPRPRSVRLPLLKISDDLVQWLELPWLQCFQQEAEYSNRQSVVNLQQWETSSDPVGLADALPGATNRIGVCAKLLLSRCCPVYEFEPLLLAVDRLRRCECGKVERTATEQYLLGKIRKAAVPVEQIEEEPPEFKT